MILILGMPRSGTSKLCNILETFGFDFNLKSDDILDDIYKPYAKFYQSKKLHIEVGKTNAIKFEKCEKKKLSNNTILNLLNSDIVKEPYLLFLLDSIRHKIDKIILIIRHPHETISSCKKFLQLNNSNKIIDYSHWNKYHLTFLQEVKNIPYIIINYNNLEFHYDAEIIRLKQFVINQDKSKIQDNDYNFTFINNNKYLDENIPSLTKYIYNNLISENTDKYNEILDNYQKFINLKPNDLCFCNSGKKYKKCCNLIR